MDILEEARRLRQLIEVMAEESLDDETALDNINVFPSWKVGVLYEKDFRLKYDGILYKVLQNHTSQADWTPDVAYSLYVNIADPHVEYPDWVQPLGAQDAYAKDSRVSHLVDEHGNKRHWISIVDANVWEPSVYGWEEILEEE